MSREPLVLPDLGLYSRGIYLFKSFPSSLTSLSIPEEAYNINSAQQYIVQFKKTSTILKLAIKHIVLKC